MSRLLNRQRSGETNPSSDPAPFGIMGSSRTTSTDSEEGNYVPRISYNSRTSSPRTLILATQLMVHRHVEFSKAFDKVPHKQHKRSREKICRWYQALIGRQEPTDLRTTQENMLESWSDTWLMPFNVRKCKTIHLGTNNPCLPYYLRGLPIQKATEECDLESYSIKLSNQVTTSIRKSKNVTN
jgi:hypothetical protein